MSSLITQRSRFAPSDQSLETEKDLVHLLPRGSLLALADPRSLKKLKKVRKHV